MTLSVDYKLDENKNLHPKKSRKCYVSVIIPTELPQTMWLCGLTDALPSFVFLCFTKSRMEACVCAHHSFCTLCCGVFNGVCVAHTRVCVCLFTTV